MLVIHCSLYMRFEGGYAWITFAYGYNMIMIEDNRWMYDGLNKSEAHSYEWIMKTKGVFGLAFSFGFCILKDKSQTDRIQKATFF